MQPPPIPADERERLKRLYCLRILDTPAEERFDRYTRMAQRLFQVPIALVSIVDAERQWFKSRQGLTASETAREVSFCGYSILDDEVFVVEDAQNNPRFDDNPLVAGPPKIRFYAGCPVPIGQGSALGTLCVIDTKPRTFSQVDRRLLMDLGEMVAGELVTTEMAMQDELTGVASRHSFMALATKAFEGAKRQKTELTLAYVDIDGFKGINDALGHGVGDQALKEIALTLKSSFRSSDIIGRIGGDEFCMVLVGADRENTRSVVEVVKRRLRARNQEKAKPYELSVSVGIAEYDPSRHRTFGELLEHADAAMYREKHTPLPVPILSTRITSPTA
jgi:diguanylate cyclase (GGDEF)-like protein